MNDSLADEDFDLRLPKVFFDDQQRGSFPPAEFEHLHHYLFATQFCRGQRVLDVACGTGYGSFLLAQAGARVLGVDGDPLVIKKAEETFVARDLKFRAGDCTAIPADNSSFDVIVCFGIIEHVTAKEQALDELKRVLKADGCLIISVASGQSGEMSETPGFTDLQFSELLQRRFTHVTEGRQRALAGSAILTCNQPMELEIHYREELTLIVSSPRLAKPSHLIAVASGQELPDIKWGLFDDAYFWKSLRDQKANQLAKIQEVEEVVLQKTAKINYVQAVFCEQLAEQARVIEAQSVEVTDLRRQIAALCSSTSWRITAPIRKLKSLLKMA